MTIQEALQELRRAYPQGGWCLDGDTIRGEIATSPEPTALEVVSCARGWTCKLKGSPLEVSCTAVSPVDALYGAIGETLKIMRVAK
jgi:hypothetical protein